MPWLGVADELVLFELLTRTETISSRHFPPPTRDRSPRSPTRSPPASSGRRSGTRCEGWALGLARGGGDRDPGRDRRRLQPPAVPVGARGDRVPAPDPVGRADPAGRADLGQRAGEQGVPGRVRRHLAAADADALRRPGRRPRGDRHGALVRLLAAAAAAVRDAAERRAVHRHRRADLGRRGADPGRHGRARDRRARPRPRDQHRAPGRGGGHHVRADRRHRAARLGRQRAVHARRAARAALAPVAAAGGGAREDARARPSALEIARPARAARALGRVVERQRHVLLPAAHRHPRRRSPTRGCSSASAATSCRASCGSRSATRSRASVAVAAGLALGLSPHAAAGDRPDGAVPALDPAAGAAAVRRSSCSASGRP